MNQIQHQNSHSHSERCGLTLSATAFQDQEAVRARYISRRTESRKRDSCNIRVSRGPNGSQIARRLLLPTGISVYRSSRFRPVARRKVILICFAASLCLLGISQILVECKSIDDTTSKGIEGSTVHHDLECADCKDSHAGVKREPGSTTESPTTSTESAPTTIADEVNSDVDEDEANSEDSDEDCRGLSINEPAEAKNYTDRERLVNLQSCLQSKVRRRIQGATRSGLEMFDKLSLTGGCTASLINLMSSMGDLKSFAFKFLDASAKIPSGMMYGLLSDFGDFDQCLSIRSNPRVRVEDEAEENAYSGKYCLLSLKLNYHIRLDINKTVPEGIIPDGVIWDELVRNYWTSDSSKGFQVGMCFPSRCTNDDLDQIFRQVTKGYNVIGEVMSCQDGNDLRVQHSPDTLQLAIMYSFYFIISLTVVGTLFDRYFGVRSLLRTHLASLGQPKLPEQMIIMLAKTLLCFSIIRNWRKFMYSNQSSFWDHLVQNSESTQQKNLEPESPTCSSQGRSIDDGTDSELIYSKSTGTMETNSTSTDTAFVGKLSPLTMDVELANREQEILDNRTVKCPTIDSSLKHLAGLKLFIIIWITIGHSFLYPSANNYQYYRSITNMNITRDSVWFATTNFTLGIDMLLYIAGLAFVVRLANLTSTAHKEDDRWPLKQGLESGRILQLLFRKISRFWPTYMSVIALAIVVQLVSDGPMWPEMVNKRLGEACRKNWWSNLLIVNNFLNQSEVCLPSSWFVSVLMQLFIIGSLVILVSRKLSLRFAIATILLLLMTSMGATFLLVYTSDIRAPVIRMDESFVMDLDDKIYNMYTSLINNLGPFVIGMLGGFMLVDAKYNQREETVTSGSRVSIREHSMGSKKSLQGKNKSKFKHLVIQIFVALAVAVIAILVLSSVFHQNYTKLWASVYWSTHRIGWAIVTGYIIHQCAMGSWKLLNDFLSLSTFVPLSKLIFIAYLVYPIFIHIHSGLVRDGLHVSIYNMTNIYTTRLVMTFATAALIHLLIELPFCSIEELYLKKWMMWISWPTQEGKTSRTLPLLAVSPIDLNFNGSRAAKNQEATNFTEKNETAS